MTPTDEDTLWRFVRGDMVAGRFEDWIYAHGELEAELGPALFLRAISADFRSHDEVEALRADVEKFLRESRPARCACLEMRDFHVVVMGHHERLFATLIETKRRGSRQWWLRMVECSACRQHWLLGAEELKNDVFCLRRMEEVEAAAVLRSDAWPSDFDRYVTLVRHGIAAGIVFRWVDPMDSRHTMVELAKETPGIRVSEVAHLLTLDTEMAAAVARIVVASENVEVTFDGG